MPNQPNVEHRTMFTRDNLEVLRGIDNECIDLIYLDPPFNSKHDYAAPIGSEAAGAAFKDTWTLEDIDVEWIGLIADEQPKLHAILAAVPDESDKAYLVYMSIRLLEMHRVLEPTGSIYLHCDPTMSAWLRIVLDSIFGKGNFQNEIVWHYRRWTGTAHRFLAMHDVLFFYTKQESGYVFNSLYTEYTEKSLKRKQNYHTRIKGDDVYVTSIDGKGVKENDVWMIPVINSQAKERVGYPTQKPLALLERVIEASTNKGDLVLDPFCGCATACVAAEKLGRQWIGIDISPKAAELVKIRAQRELSDFLSSQGARMYQIIHRTDIPRRSGAIVRPRDVRHRLYGLQEGRCKGCEQHFEFRHFHVDHIIPRSRGGQDVEGNLQLLCGSCNVIKGDKDMPYLRSRLREIGAAYAV